MAEGYSCLAALQHLSAILSEITRQVGRFGTVAGCIYLLVMLHSMAMPLVAILLGLAAGCFWNEAILYWSTISSLTTRPTVPVVDFTFSGLPSAFYTTPLPIIQVAMEVESMLPLIGEAEVFIPALRL